MNIRSAFLAVTLAVGVLDPELVAQNVQYTTAAMHTVSARPEVSYVSVVRRRYPPRRRYVVKRRSKKKSVAIVGGSAAAGAAIGALAGGGKGAAIGAIAGGGGGYIYDRHTHKKVYRRY